MRPALLIGGVLLVCLMMLFPPVRYSQGGSMESPGYKLNTATLFANTIVAALTAGLAMTFRSRR